MTTADLEHDVPAQAPDIAIAVNRVQITNQQILVPLEDRLIGHAQILCQVTAGCDLPAVQRGIHMSRIEQAFDVASAEVTTFPMAALLIAERIAETQGRPTAHVHLSGDVVLRNRTPVTDLVSLDVVTHTAQAVLGPDAAISIELSATNMTACPCMQAYALDDLITHFAPETLLNGSTERVRAAARQAVPVATHSQKGRVTITVELPLDEYPGSVAASLPDLAELHEILSDGTTLTSEMLKRPDEYAKVKAAHERAQFVEDVVRDTARAATAILTDQPAEAIITINAASFESIHGHDIEATLSSSLQALRTQLN
jgi:MptA/FolE2 family GTP cyclohydrolase